MALQRVLLTDHPWPDVEIERSILDAAGYFLVAGPVEAPSADAIEALASAHQPKAIMCCWAQVSSKAIAAVRDLHIVARLGVGLDNIAVAAATERGAWVTNVPDYCVEEVSDHAIAMLLSHWRGIHSFDREAKLGRWEPATANLKRIRNMTVGIVGYGRIGRATARKLTQGFGAQVLVTSPTLLATHRDGTELAKSIRVATLAGMQMQADAIVLHLPLTPSSRELINEPFLAGLQRKPLLVNVSRGGLIDHAALLRALDAGWISGAALDVVAGEPNPPAEIIGRKDILVTPHVAFSSDAALAELRQRCTKDVVRALRGEQPLHPCNSPAR